MRRRTPHDWLRSLERSEPLEQWALLCFLAGGEVEIDEDERNAAVRRAELLLATGGDPHRAPDLYGRAVSSVASDLDAPERRRALSAGLHGLTEEIAGLRAAGEALRLLTNDGDLAWQVFAYSILVERLAEET